MIVRGAFPSNLSHVVSIRPGKTLALQQYIQLDQRRLSALFGSLGFGRHVLRTSSPVFQGEFFISIEVS